MIATYGPRLGAFLVIIIGMTGCGGAGDEAASEMRGNTSDNFRVIETAYRTALEKQSRAPKNRDELAKHLPPDTDIDQLFVSPRDEQPFTMVWGTDLRKMMTSAEPVVYGYEVQGASGKRFVLTTMGVMEMTDEDFAAASFPAGHSPAP